MCNCVFPEVRVSLSQKISPHLKSYYRWYSMLDRCYNPDRKDFKNYGARGIRVCEQWIKDFQQYVSDVGVQQKGLTLDRIKNDEGYCPHNVKWSTRTEQGLNRRSPKKKSNLPFGVYAIKSGFVSYLKVNGAAEYVGFSKDAKKLSKKFNERYLEVHGRLPN